MIYSPTSTKVLLLFLLSAMTLDASAQSKREKQIRETELIRFDAMTRRDTALLHALLAPDLTYTHSNGLTETRQSHLESIAAGRIVYQSMNPIEMDIHTYGRTAVVTGIVAVKGKLGEKVFDIRLRYLNVYRKHHGKWQLSAWQSLSIP